MPGGILIPRRVNTASPNRISPRYSTENVGVNILAAPVTLTA